ncbi:hypothetical protein FQZ97_460440 [compost metagenome]
MEMITVEVGETRLETPHARLALAVLEGAVGIGKTKSLTIANSEHPTTPPAIGQYWRGQGGIYAGLMRGENGRPDYHLIVPTAPEASTKISWGAAGEGEDGATSDFDGLANTRGLVESEHEHPAAQWAAGLEIEGHRDFYLPARRELRLCWVNVPELFEKGWHWSSTQFSPYDAWIQDFDDGAQYDGHKDDEGRARAVRRVLTTSAL